MTFRLSKRSLHRLEGVHQDLVDVVHMAIGRTVVDFGVSEGVRTLKRQEKLVAAGASTTMNSRHLTGHAVDLVAYIGSRVAWDWPLYDKIAFAMKAAAGEIGIHIEWGGEWTTFRDGPHFQLPWDEYPKGD